MNKHDAISRRAFLAGAAAMPVAAAVGPAVAPVTSESVIQASVAEFASIAEIVASNPLSQSIFTTFDIVAALSALEPLGSNARVEANP